jgi:hypothetical protein
MTESEWLTSEEPEQLLLFLTEIDRKDRKFRLFGCACGRRVWDLLAAKELREAVETAERFANTSATGAELEEARTNAARLCRGEGDIIADHGPMAVASLCEATAGWFMPAESTAAVAAEARFDEGADWNDAHVQEERAQAALVRDVFGNPFRPIAFAPVYLTPTVISLAEAAYNERHLPSGELDSHRLAVLADALEEAGAPVELLDHLRSPGPHVRGCFAVDLCLGLSCVRDLVLGGRGLDSGYSAREDSPGCLDGFDGRPMRYEIIVDHVARICVWKSCAHYGVMHEDLAIPVHLRDRIDQWIDWHIDLNDRLQDDPDTYAGWLDYDEEGREIARQVKPALGPAAEVYYFCRATEEYERVT